MENQPVLDVQKVNHTSIWKQKNFLAFWGSESLNSLALLLMQVSIMIKVYEATNSVLGSASILAIRSFCSFIGSLTAAQFIERLQLVKLIRYLNRARFLISMIMGIVIFLKLPLVFILFLYYTFTLIASWYGPSRVSLITSIVDRNQYLQARGSISMVNQLIQTAGWGLGGVLTIFFPFPVLIGLVSVCFLLSSVMSSMIPVESIPAPERSKAKQGSSFKLLFTIPIIRTITFIQCIEGLANVVWTSAFLLSFTNTIIHKGNEWWGYLNASYFIGAIVGSLIVIRYSKFLGLQMGNILNAGSFVIGILTSIFILLPVAPVSAFLCITLGAMFQVRDTGLSTVFIDSIDQSKRASVTAAKNSILSPWYGVTFIIMGFVSELTSITAIYVMAALLYMLAGIFVLLNPSLRKFKYSD